MASIATPMDLVFGNDLLLNKITKYLKRPDLAQLRQINKLGQQTATPLLLKSPQLRSLKQFEAFSRAVGNSLPNATRAFRYYGHLVQVLDFSRARKLFLAMTYDLIIPIFMYCRRLKVFDFKRCFELSGDVFRALFLAGRELCASLTSLNITGMNSIVQHLKVVFRRLPNITTLILNRTNVNDKVVLIISQCMPRLEHLEIVKCGQVTDIAILALASGCPKLAYLLTRRCKRIQNISLLEQISARGGKEVVYDDSGSDEEYSDFDDLDNDYY
ncbi:hypothetical protein GGH91_000807 [Coemansia sp. RSA 2671]|nr:hypothetical protein GGH91_000807 [Coemansia sp. RSA 2671]